MKQIVRRNTLNIALELEITSDVTKIVHFYEYAIVVTEV